MSNIIGVLWKKEKKEMTYYSGIINDLRGAVRIAIFPNERKEADNQPDMNIVVWWQIPNKPSDIHNPEPVKTETNLKESAKSKNKKNTKNPVVETLTAKTFPKTICKTIGELWLKEKDGLSYFTGRIRDQRGGYKIVVLPNNFRTNNQQPDMNIMSSWLNYYQSNGDDRKDKREKGKKSKLNDGEQELISSEEDNEMPF